MSQSNQITARAAIVAADCARAGAELKFSGSKLSWIGAADTTITGCSPMVAELCSEGTNASEVSTDAVEVAITGIAFDVGGDPTKLNSTLSRPQLSLLFDSSLPSV